MKHVEEFRRFLLDEVNLNKSRIEILTDRIDAIQSFLKDSGWAAKIIRFSPQGSWAHKTIIKPPGDQGFDADVLVFVQPVAAWKAEDYIVTLKDVFRASGTYKDKVHLHTRCVRLEYAGDFEIDVVPCVVNRAGGTYKYEVCNRTDNKFEATDGEAYTAWLSQRNGWTGTNKLREVTRLLKYLRDIKTTFTCKSILLTTLLGNHVTQANSLFQPTYFLDLPTALKTLTGRLDAYLQARPALHDICNPVFPQESFNRHWDEDKYANFRDMIHRYCIWVDEAYNEREEAESIAKWQHIFGDEFGKDVKGKTLLEQTSATALVTVNPGYGGLVQAVRSMGVAILKNFRVALPWVKTPPWQDAKVGGLVVHVRATLHDTKGGPSTRAIASGNVLPKHKNILFQASSPTGVPFSSTDFQLHWQVVNTDRDALNANALRGGFTGCNSPGRRWEYTQYHGVHWVQAFVVRKRDGRCVGRSERFFVVIE